MKNKAVAALEPLIGERILTYIAAAAFLAGVASALTPLNAVSPFLYGLSLLSGGAPVAIAALRKLGKRKISISLLVTVAAFGAVYLGQLAEAAAVMFFFALAEAFEDIGKSRSRKAIEALLDRSPKILRLKDGSEIPVADAVLGQVFVVRPGDTIPLDGIVLSGESSVDEAAITGESLPRQKTPGESIYAGTLNQNGYLEARVSKISSETMLAKIIKIVDQAQMQKPKTQEFLDRFAGYYIPAAIGLSLVVAVVPPLVTGDPFSVWLSRALILLVLACPDALVVSAPVALAAAVGGASKRGVLIKGGAFLESLSNIRVVAFDKTKTLTVGELEVREVVALHGATKEMVVADAAGIEQFSSHPLATAIVRYAKAENITPHDMTQFKNAPGRGGQALCVVCDSVEHSIGNLTHAGAGAAICDEVSTEVERLERKGMTAVVVREGKTVIGILGLTDALRSESAGVITDLKRLGVTPVMLTGDNRLAAETVATHVGISEFYGPLMPEEKAEHIGRLQKKYGQVAMVGDGVNDAPALAQSDVGIAMGAHGSDVAIETADITLMNDELRNIPFLIGLGRKTFGVVRQNVYGSLVVKGVVLLLGVGGVIGLTAAVATDAAMAILVVLNGLRLFNYGR